MKKKIALLLVLVLLMTTVLVGCGAKTPADPSEGELTKIRVAYHPTIGGSTAVAVAEELGYFEKYGLDVSFLMFTSGPPEIAAMSAGQIEFGHIGSGAASLAFSGQVDIIALDDLIAYDEIVVRADSGINSIKDLAGKTVAVQEGGAGYTLLTIALKENGMTLNDVKILNILNENIPSTYNDSKIDCWVGWKPSTTTLQDALGDNAKLLANDATYPEYLLPNTWVANSDYVEEHPEVCQAFFNALTDAMIYRQENPFEACAYASTYASQATNELTNQLGDIIFPSAEEFKAYYNDGIFWEMLENMKELQVNSITGNLSIDDIYAQEFAEEYFK